MTTIDDPSFSRITESLGPFIKTRSEALRIRRILTLYLASALADSNERVISPISLAAPGQEMYVTSIPPDMSGIRRDYLLALQANVKARQNYERLSRQLSQITEKNPSVERYEGQKNHALSVSAYLALSDIQKKEEKVQALYHYIELLRTKGAAMQDFLSTDSMRQNADAIDGMFLKADDSVAAQIANNGVQSQVLMKQLEKAVFQANESLKCERRLLEELKAKHPHLDEPTIPARARALELIRHELVSWIEQQLTTVNEAAADDEAPILLSKTENAPNIEQRRREIDKTYHDYLEVRRSIVGLLSIRRSNAETECQRKSETYGSRIREGSHKETARDAVMVLPYVTEHLIPAADVQKIHLQQEGHLSSSLRAQMQITNRVLDRLADESHLLADYPMLALQPRFKKNVAAPEGSKILSTPFSMNPKASEESNIARHAQAWTFAAEAARAATNKDLDERLSLGEQHAIVAGDTLTEMHDLISFENEGDGHDDDDLWNSVESPIVKGVWAGLDGTIGGSRQAR